MRDLKIEYLIHIIIVSVAETNRAVKLREFILQTTLLAGNRSSMFDS